MAWARRRRDAGRGTARRRGVELRSRLAPVAGELFGIDLRALAAVRIGIGVLLLTDLAVRATDLSLFYSDDGVLPRSLLLDRSSPWMISVYVLSGAPAFQGLLFALAALAALALLLGYRTRPAAILSWVLLVSLQNRDPLVNQNGDLLLRLILFWGMFLPLGARYSLDRLRSGRGPVGPARVVTAASFAFLAQVITMYVFAGLLKTGADWTRDGTAIYYALQYRLLATPRAHLLLAHTDLLSAMTHAVLWFERLGPILFFIPVVGAPIRTLAVFAFMGFHLGMSTFLALGPFMWVPQVALIAFLPTPFWDYLERRARPSGPRFDRLATAGKLAVLLPTVAFAAVPGPPASEAAARARTEQDQGDARGEAPPTERPAADVAGAGETRGAGPAARRLAAGLLPAFLLVYVLLLNLRTVSPGSYLVLPRLQWLGDSLALNQSWSMFAPHPPHASGWFVMPGVLRNGRIVDLWRGPKPVSWREPSSIEGLYPTERWRKFAENLAWYVPNQLDYARYLCRSWNTSHAGPDALVRFKIYFMLIDTPPPARVNQPDHPRRELLVTWFCFKKPPS